MFGLTKFATSHLQGRWVSSGKGVPPKKQRSLRPVLTDATDVSNHICRHGGYHNSTVWLHSSLDLLNSTSFAKVRSSERKAVGKSYAEVALTPGLSLRSLPESPLSPLCSSKTCDHGCRPHSTQVLFSNC